MKSPQLRNLYFVTGIFFVYAILSYYVYQNTAIYIHRAMIWNLFLALLPMVCCSLFLYAGYYKKKGICTLLFICWLLLFPNVPYLVTDFIHIAPLTFYTLTENGTHYVQEIWAWAELLHIAFGVWFGFLMGYRSLWKMQGYILQKWNRLAAWTMVVLVSLLSGFGVYLGRFLRLNSWDIFHPAALLEKVHTNMDVSFAIPFTFLFGFFVLCTYSLYYLMKKNASNEDLIGS